MLKCKPVARIPAILLHMPHHHHPEDHHHHSLDFGHVSRLFMVGVALNLIFVAVEFGAGFVSNSLALISDAGHNLSDVATLVLAFGAFRLMMLKATWKFTYGFRKASILVALLNAILLLVVVGGIAFKSVQRFISPQPVDSGFVIWVACIGVVINFLSALLFFRNKEADLTIKGAYLHLMADAFVSVGVVISGIIITYTQWYWIDPLTSLLIVIAIAGSLVKLLRDSISLSLDAVPRNVEVDAIRKIAMSLSGVTEIHHIHVWALSTVENALTAHLVLNKSVTTDEAAKLKSTFRQQLAKMGIQHATIETETTAYHDDHCR